jgi:peptide-methionine (R)-S-oxide reductase
MMRSVLSSFVFFLAVTSGGCSQSPSTSSPSVMEFPVQKPDAVWQQELTPEQYRVLREQGTERPYSSPLYYVDDAGVYHCAGCKSPLFTADTKFDAHCGWPSFYAPVNEKSVVERKDFSHGMIRTEVLCGQCGGHLGHVFPDGPNPTGLRYCINGAALDFTPKP